MYAPAKPIPTRPQIKVADHSPSANQPKAIVARVVAVKPTRGISRASIRSVRVSRKIGTASMYPKEKALAINPASVALRDQSGMRCCGITAGTATWGRRLPSCPRHIAKREYVRSDALGRGLTLERVLLAQHRPCNT